MGPEGAGDFPPTFPSCGARTRQKVWAPKPTGSSGWVLYKGLLGPKDELQALFQAFFCIWAEDLSRVPEGFLKALDGGCGPPGDGQEAGVIPEIVWVVEEVLKETSFPKSPPVGDGASTPLSATMSVGTPKIFLFLPRGGKGSRGCREIGRSSSVVRPDGWDDGDFPPFLRWDMPKARRLGGNRLFSSGEAEGEIQTGCLPPDGESGALNPPRPGEGALPERGPVKEPISGRIIRHILEGAFQAPSVRIFYCLNFFHCWDRCGKLARCVVSMPAQSRVHLPNSGVNGNVTRERAEGFQRSRPAPRCSRCYRHRTRVTSLRLSRMASSSAARLSTESAAARTERLASTISARRARLSVEERSLQNSQDAVCVARLRASQSPAQKTLRRLRDATAKACSRGLESPEQTTSRRLRNTRATAASTASEQPQETDHRRFRNSLSTASARALESPAQTTARRVRNARSTAVVIDADRRPHVEHERRFNAPACNEVAAVIHGEEHNSRDIVIRYRGGGLRRINETHRLYDCLQYTLLFPYGSDGYHFKIPIYQASSDSMSTSKTISCRAYYAYMFMVREGEFNHLHRCRQLFLQFAVDMAAKMESERLGFIKLNQSKLRTDSYIHLRDGLRSDGDPRNLGKPCILPSSYTGGPRYMHERTQDAITYVRHYGRPDLSVTITCNPKWVEITRELFPGQQYSHRPDLIARVFWLQLCKLMDLILKGQVFGRVKCHMYTMEWQKQSVPHAHILL
ncbi:unnamed protein product [Acanthosepion pharaonis]|uniref:Helitron helicase-like domain-containing protein n=1 Tax=Acanthosepion pharaonis TaxID=158019 RepID=A0A812CUA0_ACAPH|nr:unnamed protein product [Sepia pharaonis]